MEEENSLGLGMFDNLDLELNYDFETPPSFEDEDKPEDIQEDNKNINEAIEEDIPEDVDGGEDVEDEGGDDEGASSSSNLFSSLANVLHEQGLLPSLDIGNLEIKNVDDFTKAVKTEIDIQADTKLQEYLDNLDLTKIASSKKAIADLANIDEDYLKNNIEVAKQLLHQDYLNQGLSPEKATKLLKRLIDLGEDAIVEDSLESLNSIKEFESRRITQEQEAYKERLEADKLAQEKLDSDIKKLVFENPNLINGFKPTKSLQEKVYKTINEIVGKSPEGVFENKFMRDRRTNPLEFETRMYYFYELTNGFQDYSKLSTPAKSSAIKELEKAFKQQPIVDNGTPSWMKNSGGEWNLGSELNF